jgi:serine/threonine protein kinase
LISKQAKDLVWNMLNRASADRFSMRQCLEHSWIANKQSNSELKLSTKSLMNICSMSKTSKLQ